MEVKNKSIECQLFICTHEREHGEYCAQSKALDIFQALKTRSREDPRWKGKVSVTRSGCLGFCSEGVAAVLYPQKKWLTSIRDHEIESVFEWVESQRRSNDTP
jgi:(2Fe-2S) ferredoxin